MKKTQNWEEIKCEYFKIQDINIIPLMEKIELFIRQSHLSLLSELEEKIEKTKEDAKKFPAQYFGNVNKSEGYNNGYNQALSEILQLLKSYKQL